MTLDWSVFCKDTLTGEAASRCFSFLFGMDPNADPTYLDWLFTAWGWTLSVAGLSLVLALLLGVTIGTLRTLQPTNFLNKGLAFLGTVWVELFRNIPLLVQVFLWYHVVPAFFPVMKSFPSYLLVSIALGLFTSARIAEQVRAGIQSLPSDQRNAAIALGMTITLKLKKVLPFPKLNEIALKLN
jgi:glutamate/aspartate transport system permease protein